MIRAVTTAGLALGAVVMVAGPAGATINGPCTGSGTFEAQGRTYDADTTDVVKVPEKDTVSYQGAIEAPAGERSHHGEITLKLPAPLPSITISDWSSARTTNTSDEGVYEYDLPAFVPRGITLNLEGEHIDTAGTCSGSVQVEIEGGPFDAPLPTAVSLVATAAAAAGLVIAARPRGAR